MVFLKVIQYQQLSGTSRGPNHPPIFWAVGISGQTIQHIVALKIMNRINTNQIELSVIVGNTDIIPLN